MSRACDGTDVPVSPLPASSSNMGSPDGSRPDLEGTGYRASPMEEKINEMFVQIAKLPLLMQRKSRFESCVQTLSQTVASYYAKVTNIEHIVGSFATRVTTLETNATSVTTNTKEEKIEAMLTKRFAKFEVHSAALASSPMLVPDWKTVSCRLHIQWHLSQTKFRTLNKPLTVSQLVSQL